MSTRVPRLRAHYLPNPVGRRGVAVALDVGLGRNSPLSLSVTRPPGTSVPGVGGGATGTASRSVPSSTLQVPAFKEGLAPARVCGQLEEHVPPDPPVWSRRRPEGRRSQRTMLLTIF